MSQSKGKPEDKRSTRAEREEKILQFWKENNIFEKSLNKPKKGFFSRKKEFVFYDGPPFATGLPHYGSLLSSIIKDVIPRYKTMRGYHVRRRWGWDCHGLPIENMVEKELGLKSKKEIEKMGIDKFNRVCRDSVLRFADEWKVFVERIGRFVDYDNSYKTMDNSYIESVWWGLKEMHRKGLLYEGRKVLLYCPHCETPLAKAEVAMDNSYKDITEESVYVKFKIKNPGAHDLPENTYLLAWTTTPWTLPGNVALAVGENVQYVLAQKDNTEHFIVSIATAQSVVIDSPTMGALNIELPDGLVAKKIIKSHELIGLEYEPLYSFLKENHKVEGLDKAYKVYAADFVNTEDGTGIVHTAVMYGEDDYDLGLKVGLPMVPLLDQSAHFNEQAPEFIRGQYFKKAERTIKEDLDSRDLLFKREMHTHSYPHCHRCGTALLYNALSSWFINIQENKKKMIELNEKINWIPDHLKHGRFLHTVESAPDWTISRNRYWASPLPIWKDAGGNVHVLGSLAELKKSIKKSNNRYFIMRHGEAESNVQQIVSGSADQPFHLTEKGKVDVEKSAEALKGEKIDMIIASPFVRGKETAAIAAKVLGLQESAVIFDESLKEIQTGRFNGGPVSEYRAAFPTYEDKYDNKPEGGESLLDVKVRAGQFIKRVESQYSGKNILVVSHEYVLWMLLAVADGLNKEETLHLKPNGGFIDTGEMRELKYLNLPVNDRFELDLHRPYIDEIELISEDGKPLKRIPEVIDGWVESGSMPFAEYHYPVENKREFEKRFPGDFVAEYIAQTRTWFYYMHAVAVALFDNVAFRNVVTTGNILAVDGSKMSKSKGNYTDPMANLDTFSADTLRYYLMSSVVMQAEDTRFADDELKQVHNQVVNILWNAFNFYEIYSAVDHRADNSSDNVLDRWIISRINELNEAVTEAMESYDMVKASRPMKDFISDFSTWYIRRSRDRFKSHNETDRYQALSTTRFVLLNLAKIIAPVMPFIAEDIYQKVRTDSLSGTDPESVHLCSWPKAGDINSDNIVHMKRVRDIVSLALEARSRANIKVRQPLQKLVVKDLNLEEAFVELIKDEVNVKEVVEDKQIEAEVELDTNITEDLRKEGEMRELVRRMQELRKEAGLVPEEKISAIVAASAEGRAIFERFEKEIKAAVNIGSVSFEEGDALFGEVRIKKI